MKKNLVFVCILLFSFKLSALEWQEAWAEAIIACKNTQYNEAEALFNQAITSMENRNAASSHIYVDRARLFLLLNKNIEAIADVNKAIDRGHLSNVQRIRAIVTRLTAKARLGVEEDILQEMNYFSENCSDSFPIKEESEKYIVVRNVPDCECYWRIMRNYYISSGICSSNDDIQITESGIGIIKKSPGCKKFRPCQAKGKKTLSASELLQPKAGQHSKVDPVAVEACKNWCDRCGIAATVWCSKVFKKTWCQFVCYAAVEELRKGCHWCCSTGNFYQECVKPFEDVAAAMGNRCDPYWD